MSDAEGSKDEKQPLLSSGDGVGHSVNQTQRVDSSRPRMLGVPPATLPRSKQQRSINFSDSEQDAERTQENTKNSLEPVESIDPMGSLQRSAVSQVLGATDAVRRRRASQVTHREQNRSHVLEFIKPAIYGGMDGIVSVFIGALIAVVTDQPLVVVLALTLAKLFAGAFSMGSGEYLATMSDVDYAKGERAREEWEVENFIEGELKEMEELYVSNGYSEETARKIVAILAKDKKILVDSMMVEELEIPLDQAEQSPLKNAMVNFASFMIFGTIPVAPFIVFIIGHAVACPQPCPDSIWSSSYVPLYISIGATALGVLILALLKSSATGITVWISIAQSFAGAILSVAFGGGLGYAIFYATGASV